MLRKKEKTNNKINHKDFAEAGQPKLAAGRISMVLLAGLV